MSPLFTVITIGISIILCYTIYIVIDSKQQAKKKTSHSAEPKPDITKEDFAEKPMLDDTSYIQEMKHLSGKVGFMWWQQYDILLATHPYYWEAMVDDAAYMETADFDSLESLQIGALGENDLELAHVYNQNKVGLKNFERLKEEQGSLSISGHSRTLNDKVKIVWFNQTRVLRVFTPINDETLIKRYVKTLIRKAFTTPR